MPLDVIMPALGMAQDTGLIVAWHKRRGDAVAKGDVLLEVETDKATVEIEAQGDGFLTDVTADAGAEVPVGEVIARISASADSAAPTPQAAPESVSADDLPTGKTIIMPTLGMAQDTGLLVAWLKAPGDAVAADDLLFEVETDKSTVEVPAGADGYVAALLAQAGDDVPVGQTIAIISAQPPASLISRAAPPAVAKAAAPVKPVPVAKSPARIAPVPALPVGGRILVSPKARRLAREQGLDLALLVKAGHPQPFHVKDLAVLKSLPVTPAHATVRAAGRLTADVETSGFADFAAWAAQTAKLIDANALMAGLCAASFGAEAIVAVESFGQTRIYAAGARLGKVSPSEDAPQIRLRDLRATPIAVVQVGAEDIPTLTLMRKGAGLTITLEYAGDDLGAAEAITLLSNFAGRMEQPLRHLL
ncbi:MAG: pyruvate dehydrogenase E2 component (dihydrolipoamide acetyltransferase) [Paracoccaceae bacterium]|jgi:pyruvate dehydrogenase E2 component (dihydrolipoamide acetyltransferase)/2-oxoglutarate dehydrogenase E2 component (dihydrolipoamide succinyltransferase)